MRWPPLRQLEARRVALLKPSALGDIIHALPVAHALRCRFPDAEIFWVVNRDYAPLLHRQPDITACIEFDRHGGLRRYLNLLHDLRRKQFDLVIDLQGLLRTGLMALVCAPARRVGLSNAREGSHWCYTDVVPIPRPRETHAVDQYWHVAEALGVGGEPKLFRLTLDESARAWAHAIWSRWPRPWLVVAPGARWQTKRWPTSYFAELLQHFGGPAILVGSTSEGYLAQAVAANYRGPTVNLAGRTTLPQLAALLSLADVVLANDTGPMHLAVALGRKVVVPYTCTQIARHGPYVRGNHSNEALAWPVATHVRCHGSYRKRCRRMDCLRDLTPDRLWPALHEALEQCRSSCRAA
jgi:heptosyltransferase-1